MVPTISTLSDTVIHMRIKHPLDTWASVLPRDLSCLRTAFPTANNSGPFNIVLQMEESKDNSMEGDKGSFGLQTCAACLLF